MAVDTAELCQQMASNESTMYPLYTVHTAVLGHSHYDASQLTAGGDLGDV